MRSVGCGPLGILFLADYFLLRLSFFLLLDHLLTLSAIKTTLVLQNDFATATGPAGETSNAVFQGNRENGMYFLCQLDFKLVQTIYHSLDRIRGFSHHSWTTQGGSPA